MLPKSSSVCGKTFVESGSASCLSDPEREAPGTSMSTPTPTKLAAHLAKFRYETAAIPAIQSPKREPVDPAPAIVSPQIRRTPAKRKRDLKLEDEYVERSPSSPDGQTSTKVRKVKVNRPYASPETYAHLKAVPDLLRPGLKLVFCGIKSVAIATTCMAFI